MQWKPAFTVAQYAWVPQGACTRAVRRRLGTARPSLPSCKRRRLWCTRSCSGVGLLWRCTTAIFERAAVHLSLVACVQGNPTNPWMEKNHIVRAISDIQLWCLRPLVELGRPLRLCMVMDVLRKFFILWVTLIFLWSELFVQDKAHSRKAEPYNKK